jgi:predicted DNA binding CopG/RHH family protein
MEDAKQKISTNNPKNISINQQNQTPNNQHNTQNQQDKDSFTEVHVARSGRRVPVGIRIDSGLWEAFKKTLSANGLSTCEILEHLILGLTVGLTVKVHSGKTINVYAEIPKFVKRVRRARVEYVDEREERFFCGLRNDFVEADGLPLSDCQSCPNGSCRGFVLGRG